MNGSLTGNNIVSLGNGTNTFTAGNGNNTYTGGTGVDTVTVGSGINTITTGTGADVIRFTAPGANVNTYSTITDASAGDSIGFFPPTVAASTFVSARVVLPSATASFQDYANAVVTQAPQTAHDGAAGGGFALGWFQWSGDTYLVQVAHNTTSVSNQDFLNGTDYIVRLTGLVDLSTATGFAATGAFLTLG